MRVLMLHDDEDDAQSIHAAACRCWGGRRLVQTEVASDGKELLGKLATPSRWPDVVLAAWSVLEHERRLLIVAEGSDECGRAVLQQAGDGIVMVPVTTGRPAEAMTGVSRGQYA